MKSRTQTASRPATRFLSPENVAAIVARKGVAACLEGMAACLRDDFLRWNAFDKRARVASHSPHGVIELMPIADASALTPSSTSTATRRTRATACRR